MVDTVNWRNGEWEIAEGIVTASPLHPFSVSQKVWYDQALTRSGEEG